MATWTSITRKRWTRILSRNLKATECAEPPTRRLLKLRRSDSELALRGCIPKGGLPMSRNSAKHAFIALLSLLTIGAALSIGTVKAEDVTEDQILKALAPEKKPLTRSLSMGPPVQADPAAAEAEGKLLQSLRNRSTRSLSM